MSNKNDNNKPKPVAVCVRLSPDLRAAYRAWWERNGFQSESDAIRFHVRQVTGFNPSQAQPA